MKYDVIDERDKTDARKKNYFQYKDNKGNYYLVNPYDKWWKFFFLPLIWWIPIKSNKVYKVKTPQYKVKNKRIETNALFILLIPIFAFLLLIILEQWNMYILPFRVLYFLGEDVLFRLSEQLWIRIIIFYSIILAISFIIWKWYAQSAKAVIKLSKQELAHILIEENRAKFEGPSVNASLVTMIMLPGIVWLPDENNFWANSSTAALLFLFQILYFVFLINIIDVSMGMLFILIVLLMFCVAISCNTFRFSASFKIGRLSDKTVIRENYDIKK